MIWSNILELLINFKLEFATLAFNMTPFGPYGFYKQVNNSGQLEFKSLKLVSINNGVGLCYETPNEVVVFIGNVLPPNSNNDIYLADTPEDVADIPTAGLNAGDLVYIISTESYQSWDGDSWEDYTPGEPLIPPLADVLDQGNTSGPNDIVFDASQGLLFDNNSRLREGTIDAGLGGSKGIAQICGVGYELKWEAGRLYVMGDGGTTIRQSLYNFNNTPTATDDSDLGYAVGSLWTLDDGTTYECIDATPASADWIIRHNFVFTKDANDNIFYKGVIPTLGTSCSKNIFYKTGGAITLGNGAIGNIFEPTENTTNFVFGNNLRNVTIKAGNYPANPSAGTLTLTAAGYNFMYGKDYPAQIFVGANANAYHSYYDGANNRYVITNLVTLASINIGGSSGTVTSVNAGTNISVTGTATDPIINSLADRYKTTSNSTNTISNTSKTFTVSANLAYIPLQEVLIVYDASNHMHGTVTSYSATTLVVDVKTHTGGGTFADWVINLDGVPIDAITGVGTVNRLAYFTAAQVIDDAAAITAARALISDANGIPTHSTTTSTELGYVSGVTSAIQTQIDIKEDKVKTFNRQIDSYTLVLGDAGKVVEMSKASANTLTIPPGSGVGSVAFPTGTIINVVQHGGGQTTISGPGVNLRSSGGFLKLAAQYSACTLLKIDTNEWYVFGQLAP